MEVALRQSLGLRMALSADGAVISTDAWHLPVAVPEVEVAGSDNEAPRTLRARKLLGVSRATMPHGLGRQERWTLRYELDGGLELAWQVGFITSLPAITFQLILHNTSAASVAVRSMTALGTGQQALGVQGDAKDWWLCTLAHASRLGSLAEVLPSENECTCKAWQGFGLPVPFELPREEYFEDGHWRSYTDFLTLYSAGGERGCCIAPASEPAAFVRHRCHVDDGKIRLHARCEMNDVVLEPGEMRGGQELVLLAMDYAEALRRILGHLGDSHGRRTHRGPQFGWCSWYQYYNQVTESAVLALTQAVKETHLPMQVIQIDDGFQKQVGDWEYNERFGDGLANAIEAARSANAMPGIWLAPLAVHDSTSTFKEHPDWFQRDASGKFTSSANNWGPTSYWLDPTHPGAREFIRQIVRRHRGQGMIYFKIDFNTIDANARFHDRRKTSLEAYRDLYRLYRQEIGEESYLLACSSFTRGVFGFADAVRIGPDSGAQWEAAHPCTILECIRATGSTAAANGVLFANDPDVSYTKPRGSLTTAEWQTWHSLVGLCGGMAMFSEPFHEPGYASTTDMAELLNPPAVEKGQSWSGGVDRNHTRFGFVASRPWGDSASVLLWNPAALSAAIHLDCDRLAEALGERVHAWSFWDRCYQGIVSPRQAGGTAEAHGCKLMRLTPVSPVGRPTVIGSTLHISMGAAEIANVYVTAKQITVELSDAGARSGALFLHSDRPLMLESTLGLRVSGVTRSDGPVWRVDIEQRERRATQSITLSLR